MNEQLLSVIIAAVVGLLTNVIIKKIEKEKEPEDKQKIAVETAEMSLDILKQTLEIVERKNKELEELLLECEKTNKLINELYSIIFTILNDKEIIMPDSKRKELIDCIDRRKNAQLSSSI